MPSPEETTPKETAELLALVASLQHENAHLKLLVAKLQRQQFGRRSEKLSDTGPQLSLLDKQTSSVLTTSQSVATADKQPAIPSSRKPLPAHLPREVKLHRVKLSHCPDCGSKLRAIGEDVSEMLEYVPAHFKVIRHVRPKLACGSCDKLHQASAVERPIVRGLPGPGLLAQVLVSKYCDHLPLYRQSQIYAREGVELSRSTLAGWVGEASALLRPLLEAIRRHVLSGPTLHADDTPVPVLSPGKGSTKTGRFWTYVRDERPAKGEAPPAVWFAYSPDRKGIHPQTHLSSYSGIIHADGYAGFNQLYDRDVCIEAACWAHVRRKFHDLYIAQSSPLAASALSYIQQLYQIESHIRGQPPDRRKTLRQRQSRSILHTFHAWLESTLIQVSAKSALAGAIRYALVRWAALTRYLDDGRIEIDNNAAERALRSVALGRKNYLFMGSDRGGDSAAALYSLIGTARLNGLNPQAYLREILGCIATHPINRIDELLPWQMAEKLTPHQRLAA